VTPDPPRADRVPPRTEIRVRVSVRGRVQVVWFRGATREQAERLGVVGWARNLPDGSVEVVAQGTPEAVEQLVAWCRQGPPGARVASVDVAREATGRELEDFRIRG
jgi:acylphosphatase